MDVVREKGRKRGFCSHKTTGCKVVQSTELKLAVRERRGKGRGTSKLHENSKMLWKVSVSLGVSGLGMGEERNVRWWCVIGKGVGGDDFVGVDRGRKV